MFSIKKKGFLYFSFSVCFFLLIFFFSGKTSASSGDDLFILDSGASSDRVHTVCSGPCDFHSIQAALNSASSGDRIVILESLYDQRVEVVEDVVLEVVEDKMLQGQVYLEAPSLKLPQGSYLSFSELSLVKEGDSLGVEPEKTEEVEKDCSSTISTPLFDVSIQSKTENQSGRDIAITLFVFFLVFLTVIGYFVFGYIVHKKSKKKQNDNQ